MRYFLKYVLSIILISAFSVHAWGVDETIYNAYNPDYVIQNGASATDQPLIIGNNDNSQLKGDNYVYKDGNGVTFTLTLDGGSISYDGDDLYLGNGSKGTNKSVYLSWNAPDNFDIKVTKIVLTTRVYSSKEDRCTIGATATGSDTQVNNVVGQNSPVTAENTASGFASNLLISYYYTNSDSWLIGSRQTYISGIEVSYQLTYQAKVFGFSAVAEADGTGYGTAGASVSENVIYGSTPTQTSATTTATYTATVHDGNLYRFVGWYREAEHANQVTTVNPYEVTMDNTTAGSLFKRTLYAKFAQKGTPIVICNIADDYDIGHAEIDLAELWTREGNGAVTYSIVENSFVPSGTNNEGAVAPALRDGRYLSFGQAGTLRLRMDIAADGSTFLARTETKDITINKLTPVFTWDGDAEVNDEFEYLFNSVHKEIFHTSSGNEVPYTLTSDSVYTANMLDDTLYVYNVDEIAHITASQPETYKWNAHEKVYTIRPQNANNHVPFTVDNDNKGVFVTAAEDHAVWNNANGYKMGDDKWILNNAPYSYVIFAFEGIPDKLNFRATCDKSGITDYIGSYPVANNYFFDVYESADGTWEDTPIWSNPNREKDYSEVGEQNYSVQLSATTRYVKLCYHGTCYGHYRNINITEAHRFETDPASVLDFGKQGQNYGQQVMTVNFDHANAGRVTTAAITGADADKFTVMPEEIVGTGHDLAASTTLRVTFDNLRTNRNAVRGETEPYNAQMVITDNQSHVTTVNLVGYRHGQSYPQFTFNPNHVPYYFGTTIHVPVASTNEQSPLTITSSDPSIAEVVNGTLVIKHIGSEVAITVSQEGQGDFRAHTETFRFTPREEPPLKVPFMMSKTIYDNSEMVVVKGKDCDWTHDGYIRSGWSDWQATASGRYWDDRKVFVVAFSHTPDKLSFTAKNTYCSIRCRWKVEQSPDGVNWSQVFYKEKSCKEDVFFSDIQLDPTTQFLRFQYGGNYTGYFKDINVTSLDGIKYMLTNDGKYLSRGSDYGTRAIVDEFGLPVRVTRYTADNTNYQTQVQFMDSRQFLYEAGGDNVFTDNAVAGSQEIQWEQILNGDKVAVRSVNTGRGNRYIKVDASGNLMMTSTESEAAVWEVEDYTIHAARIEAKLDRAAATAAEHDFGSEINTMAKVRSMLLEEDFDYTDKNIEAVSTPVEQKGVYRWEYPDTRGTFPVYNETIDNLEPGFYRLTVRALYKPSPSPVDWENHEKGYESVVAYVYANDFKFPIKSVYDETGRHISLVEGDTLCPDGYYPGNLASAGVQFSAENKYLHDLYVYVKADAGKSTGSLHYGIVNQSYVPGVWLAYSGFKLEKIARKIYYFDSNEGSGTEVWGTANNWEYQSQRAASTPNEKNEVVIQSDVVVSGEFKAYSLTVEDHKTVTIAATGGLSVGKGGVNLGENSRIILQACKTGAEKGKTGYLRVSPSAKGDMPEATVEMYSTAYYDAQTLGSKARWQMVGAPIADEGMRAYYVYKKNWVYSWDETKNDWYNNLAHMTFEPFIGFETTQKVAPDGMTMSYNGRLVSGKEVITKNLARTDASHGFNAMANSFAAPIAIEKFADYDAFVHTEATIYILNAGTNVPEVSDSYNAAGKFFDIPIANAATMAANFGTPLTIPSMQGFFLKATDSGAQVRFDYGKLVWDVDYTGVYGNKPLRAPKHTTNEGTEIGSLQVTLYANGEVDHLYMLENEAYGTDFENGYDAHKMMDAGMGIFSIKEEEYLSVDATNNIIGTRIGVRTGGETAYTFVFSHLKSENEMVLRDTETDEDIDIREGGMYTFFAEPNSVITGRFMILEAEAPSVATGVEDVQGDNVQGTKAHKFVKDGQLFILKNGVLYDATGNIVRK